MEAQREFEESIASRKSCLQILIVIVEFLSNSMIKRGQCVLEAKSKEQQAISVAGGASSPDTAGRKSVKHSGRSNIQPVIITNISAQQHDQLTQLIYNNYDLLDVIYKQIVMRIPDQMPEAAAPEQANQKKATKKPAVNNNYPPSCEEIKLSARAFASMPFSIFQKKNPIINLEGMYYDISFSVSGYFKALSKIIEKGYGNPNAPKIQSLIPNKEKQPAETQKSQDAQNSKQATYFALYALLEFIIHVPLSSDDAHGRGQDGLVSPTGAAATDGTAAPKLDRITYAEIMSCLIKTGLLQRVIQLPNAIDINNPDEEGIIRLCMKLLISIIFKGQQKQ